MIIFRWELWTWNLLELVKWKPVPMIIRSATHFQVWRRFCFRVMKKKYLIRNCPRLDSLRPIWLLTKFNYSGSLCHCGGGHGARQAAAPFAYSSTIHSRFANFIHTISSLTNSVTKPESCIPYASNKAPGSEIRQGLRLVRCPHMLHMKHTPSFS